MGYENTLITGSMSKTYSLAGIRLGWIASRSPSLIEEIASARDYTTISVSQLDDAVASYALSPSVLHSLLARNIQLAKTNISLLSAFISSHPQVCSWVKPTGGTTALVQFKKKGEVVDDVAFCKDLIAKTKVMFVPASKCFGEEFRGYVRMGFVCETEVLRTGLERLGAYVREELA
jgi:aspartate/methionine/tyrosine aminotransferase